MNFQKCNICFLSPIPVWRQRLQNVNKFYCSLDKKKRGGGLRKEQYLYQVKCTWQAPYRCGPCWVPKDSVAG